MELSLVFLRVLERYIREWRTVSSLLEVCVQEMQRASDEELAGMLTELRTFPQCEYTLRPQTNSEETPCELAASALHDLLVVNPTIQAIVSIMLDYDGDPPVLSSLVLVVQEYFVKNPARPGLQVVVNTVLALGWSDSDVNGLYLQAISQSGVDFSAFQIEPGHTLAQHMSAVIAEAVTQLALTDRRFYNIQIEHERRLAGTR